MIDASFIGQILVFLEENWKPVLNDLRFVVSIQMEKSFSKV